MVVVKESIAWCLVFRIESDPHLVYHVLLGQQSLISCERWGLTQDGVLVNDCSVHPSCSIEDTECSAEAQVNKVLSLDCDLGPAISGTTGRFNR